MLIRQKECNIKMLYYKPEESNMCTGLLHFYHTQSVKH